MRRPLRRYLPAAVQSKELEDAVLLGRKETRVNRIAAQMFPLVVALYYPFCAATVRPTVPPSDAPLAELWQRPDDLARRDLFYGPGGPGDAPDAQATYTFVERKQHGTNPGLTVRDPLGREWHV